MKSKLLLLALSGICLCHPTIAQKRYGYTVLHFRCGDDDSQRDRVYYSPIIELNTLNFPQYTDGVDPAIAPFSVRYYNYAISKWFELYLRDRYKILTNTPDKYQRRSKTVIFNESNSVDCNPDKTNAPCFFMNKEELASKRAHDIAVNRLPDSSNNFCEIVDL